MFTLERGQKRFSHVNHNADILQSFLSYTSDARNTQPHLENLIHV